MLDLKEVYVLASLPGGTIMDLRRLQGLALSKMVKVLLD